MRVLVGVRPVSAQTGTGSGLLALEEFPAPGRRSAPWRSLGSNIPREQAPGAQPSGVPRRGSRGKEPVPAATLLSAWAHQSVEFNGPF